MRARVADPVITGGSVTAVPPSKQARSRQERQKDRLAIAAAKRRETQRRRRQVVATVGAFGLILAIVIPISFLGGGSNDNKSKASATTLPTPTTTPSGTAANAGAGDAAGKPCVALKDPLPKGAPNVPIEVGPAPKTLIKKDIKIGTGAEVTAASTVNANYIGVACSTGKIFDSSWSRGQPAEFPLNGVIQGWQQGLPGMKVGGERLLGIPADEAYGATGSPPTIGPNEALWFVVDLVGVK